MFYRRNRWATVTDCPRRFRLCCAGEAQPETQTLARLMLRAYAASTSVLREPGCCYLPFVTPEDFERATSDRRLRPAEVEALLTGRSPASAPA
jgi:hypothetical protein